MKREEYESMRNWFADRPKADAGLSWAARILTAMVYVIYICTGLFLLTKKDKRLSAYLLIPGTVFVGGSLLRRMINSPRPYEQMDLRIDGMKEKEKRKGESFPSRHSLSAAVIAVIFWWLYPPAGTVMVVIAVLIAVTRVLTGKHYIKDVIAGLALGAAGGLAGLRLKDQGSE